MTGEPTGTGNPFRRAVSSTSTALLRIDHLLLSVPRRLNRPIFWVLAAASVLLLMVWLIPSWLTHAPGLRGADRLKAMADVRTLLFSVITAAGAVWGIIQAARSFRLSQIAHLTNLFQNAARQIGESEEAVRLVGVQSMAQLADEWFEQRQTCVDVLCAYLRVSRDAESPTPEQYRETRRTVVETLSEHLRPGRPHSWEGCRFDLTGACLDVGDFSRASFAKGQFIFDRVRFLGEVRFDEAQFIGADVSFRNAEFTETCQVSFMTADFREGQVSFEDAQFTGGQVWFDNAAFHPGCRVTFQEARLGEGGSVSFKNASLKRADVGFAGSRLAFDNGEVRFDGAEFSGLVAFDDVKIGGDVHFDSTILSQAEFSFRNAQLDRGELIFDNARFDDVTFNLEQAASSGGRINIAQAARGAPKILGTGSVPPHFCVTARGGDLPALDKAVAASKTQD
jgi:hypothetical protein